MRHIKLRVAVLAFILLVMPSLDAIAQTADFTQRKALKDAATSTAVWKQEQALPDIQSQYTSAVANAATLDTEKVEFTNPFTGQNQAIYFDNRTQVQLQLQKYVLPDQLGLAYTSTRDGIGLARRSMEAVALDLYLGMLSAQQSILVREVMAESSKKAFSRADNLLTLGKSTILARDTAKWQMDKTIADLEKDRASLARSKRTYAATLGTDLHAELGKLVPIYGGVVPLQSVDAYIKTALDKRIEITSLREKIRIRTIEIGIYQYREMHIIHPDTKLDYERAMLAQEQDAAALALKEYQVEMEIRAAFLSIQKDQISLKSTENSLKRQRAQLSRLNALVGAGRLTEAGTTDLRAAVMQLENAVLLSRVGLDNSYRKFRNATNIGPAFGATAGMP